MAAEKSPLVANLLIWTTAVALMGGWGFLLVKMVVALAHQMVG